MTGAAAAGGWSGSWTAPTPTGACCTWTLTGAGVGVARWQYLELDLVHPNVAELGHSNRADMDQVNTVDQPSIVDTELRPMVL